MVLALLWAMGALARPFTGTFVADGRPQWLELLSLTQTEQSVSGYLLVAEPDDEGGTKSQMVTVEGAADGSVVTLHAKTFLNLGSATFIGRVAGATLTLSFPTNTGAVASHRFLRSSEERFNAALRSWQRDLHAAYEKRRRVENAAAARAAKAEAVNDAGYRLRNAANGLEANTSALHARADFAQNLDGCANALTAMRDTVRRIDEDLARHAECSWLRDQLSYLKDQLSYLRGSRSYLEDHIRSVADLSKELQQNGIEANQRLQEFQVARASDPTGTVSVADAERIDTLIRALLRALGDECAHAAALSTDAQTRADTIVNNGARLYEETATRVAAGRCTRQ